MLISVILSTFNEPEWLTKTLLGYLEQADQQFELIIADDGSGPETTACIERFQAQMDLTIRHVWHEDEGFRKTRILNKALLASAGDYLLFSDGDCVPRRDFVSTHRRLARPGHFLSGGAIRLPMDVSHKISREDISSGRAFQARWLRSQGTKTPFYKLWKASAHGSMADWLNRTTRTKATWNGGNASTWRSAVIAANGFDERMQYGGEDRELGERLINAGLQSVQVRYSAICVHLEHARGYINRDAREVNDRIRETTRREHRTRTEHGLNLHP